MRSIFVLFAAAVVASCAVVARTPYTPKGVLGGYSEVQLEHNIFRVTFEANMYTSRTDTEEMAFLRTAEVALDKGFKYFVVTGGSLEMRHAVPPVPAQSIIPGSVTPSTKPTTGGTTLAGYPTVIYTITCFAERPATDALVYDASSIISSLKPKHALPAK